MTNTKNLRMDLKIYDMDDKNKDSRKGVQVNIKKAKLDDLKEILHKYFG